jgi:hypothetical protein
MRSMTVILFLIALGMSIALVGFLIAGGDFLSAVAWITIPISLLLCFGEVLTRRNDRVRLAILRWQYRLKGGPALPWSLSVAMRGDFSGGSTFENIEGDLVKSLDGRVRVVQPRPVNARRFVVEGIGFVEVDLDDVDEVRATMMHIDFSGMRVVPPESADVLEREVLPLVAQISQSAGGALRQESWSLKVTFDPQSNPFLGFYLRDRDPAEVASFRTTIQKGVASADKVDIDKSGIYLSSANASSIVTLARDFLTFSGRAIAPANRA